MGKLKNTNRSVWFDHEHFDCKSPIARQMHFASQQ